MYENQLIVDSTDIVKAYKKEVTDFTRKQVAVVLNCYLTYNLLDFQNWQIGACEELFDFIYKGYRLRGKIDMRFTLDSTPWLMETKTKSRIPAGLVESLAFNTQNMFYMLAQDTTKFNTSHVLYNIIRNPGLKQSKNETEEDLLRRLKKAIEKDYKHYFIRHELIYTANEKRIFRSELIRKLKDIEACSNNTQLCYRNEVNCLNPYPCNFLRACSTNSMEGYIQREKLFTELEDEKNLLNKNTEEKC
jgi:hypothetical protein